MFSMYPLCIHWPFTHHPWELSPCGSLRVPYERKQWTSETHIACISVARTHPPLSHRTSLTGQKRKDKIRTSGELQHGSESIAASFWVSDPMPSHCVKGHRAGHVPVLCFQRGSRRGQEGTGICSLLGRFPGSRHVLLLFKPSGWIFDLRTQPVTRKAENIVFIVGRHELSWRL